MIVRNDNIVRVPNANDATFETPELSTDLQPDYTSCCMYNLWNMHHALRLLIDITYPEEQFKDVRYSLLYFFDPLDFEYYEFSTFLDKDPIVAKRSFLKIIDELRNSSKTYTAYIVDEYSPVIHLENVDDPADCYVFGIGANEKGKITYLSLDYKYTEANNPSHQELLTELFETDGMTFLLHQHPEWVAENFARYLQNGLEDKKKLCIVDEVHTKINPDAEYVVMLCDEQHFQQTWRDWSADAEDYHKKVLMIVAFEEDFKGAFERTPENNDIVSHYMGRLWYPEEQGIHWDQDGNDLRDAYFLQIHRMKKHTIRIDRLPI